MISIIQAVALSEKLLRLLEVPAYGTAIRSFSTTKVNLSKLHTELKNSDIKIADLVFADTIIDRWHKCLMEKVKKPHTEEFGVSYETSIKHMESYQIRNICERG